MQVSAQCESEVAGMTIDELMREALTLDPQGRAHLAHRLLDSLDELSEAEVEQLWLAEAARRDAEMTPARPPIPPTRSSPGRVPVADEPRTALRRRRGA